MNLNKHNAKKKNIKFLIQNIMSNLAKIKKERLKMLSELVSGSIPSGERGTTLNRLGADGGEKLGDNRCNKT
jgi:hypothetical protein